MQSRTHKTLLVEKLLREGQSPSSIALSVGVSRQRVNSIRVRCCKQVNVTETSHLSPKGVRDELLIHKPVNNRKARPAWSMDEKQLMLRCVGKRHMLIFTIAQLYWRNNMTSIDIATTLDISHEKVRQILSRLSNKGEQ